MLKKILYLITLFLLTIGYADNIHKTVPVSWQEVHELIAKTCAKINPDDVDILVGISVGGLPPTALFSLELENKNIVTIAARSYDKNNNQKTLSVWNYPEKERIAGKKVLLIDDIADSGTTIKKIKQVLLEELGAKDVKIATVYLNSINCKYEPDYFGAKTTNWIVFPWEGAINHTEK